MAEKLWYEYDESSSTDAMDKMLITSEVDGSTETKTLSLYWLIRFITEYTNEHAGSTFPINATKIQGKNVTSSTPSENAMLMFDSSSWTYVYSVMRNPSGGGSGSVLTKGANNTYSWQDLDGNALKIQSVNVSNAAPTNGQALVYDSTNEQYVPTNIGGTYTLPTASTTELGGVKIDGTTITIDANGVVSATVGASTWSTITGKPFTSFGTSISVVDGVADVADDGHNHVISNVDGLQDALDGKVATVEGKGLSTEDYTTAEKTKLGTVAENANNYTLPTASTSTLGGVKVDGTTITINNGVISSSGGGGGGGGSDELWYPTYDAVTGDLSWAKSDSSTTPASAHIKGADGADGAAGADGADGLSAYASAQLGGYTDTEAAFYADLAAMQGLDAALEALL